MNQTILLICLIIIALIGVIVLTFIYIKNKTLDEIRADVYQLFVTAEHIYKESKSGKQKMDYVIGLARSMLPNWLRPFITETMLKNIIQVWFDMVKDLLDDGKYNQSQEE